MTRFASLFLLLPFSAHAADRAPGEVVDPAVMVDITPSGFDKIAQLAGALVPQSLPLPRVSAGDQAPQQCVNLIVGNVCWIPWRYAYDIHNFNVGVQLTSLSLVPHTDQLTFDATVTLNVNSAQSPGNLNILAQAADVDLFGIQFSLVDINQQCNMWLEPTPITAHTTITIQVNPQGAGQPPQVLVNVAPLDIGLDLHGLRIENCVLQDILDFVNAVNGFLGGVFGFDIYDTLSNLIEPIISNAVGGVLGNVQSQLQALFTSLAVHQQIDVLGKTLDLSIAANDLDITDDGLRATLAGSIAGSGTPDPCVSMYGITTSKGTGGDLPAIGAAPSGVYPDFIADVDDDFINEGLFAAWYEGLLCQEISSDSSLAASVPVPLDTSLLGLLSGGAYDDLFPDAAPIKIVTEPRRPPVASFGGADPIHVKVRQLGVDLYAELDGRYARMVGLEVGADLGADLLFDHDAGTVSAALDVPANAITFQTVFNEFHPEANAQIESGLSGLVGTIVGPLLGGLGSSLSFPMPAFSGLGLTDLLVSQAGPDGDMLGAFASIGPVSYTSPPGGCSGGCGGGTSGCSGGCDANGGVASPLWLAPILLIARRRRAR